MTGGPFRLAAHTPQQTIVLRARPDLLGRPAAVPRPPRLPRPPGHRPASSRSSSPGRSTSCRRCRRRRRTASPPTPSSAWSSSRRGLWGLVVWNNRRPLFADRRVRRALSLAINRKALVDTVFHGHARLATGPILSSMWAFDGTLPQLPYDPGAGGGSARAGRVAGRERRRDPRARRQAVRVRPPLPRRQHDPAPDGAADPGRPRAPRDQGAAGAGRVHLADRARRERRLRRHPLGLGGGDQGRPHERLEHARATARGATTSSGTPTPRWTA